MLVDLKTRAAQAVDIAQQAGAEDAWSSASQSRDVQFEYRDGKLEKVKDTTSQSLGIRIYADGRYSSHSTTDLNPDRLPDFIADAVAITAALEPDEYRRITPEALFRDRPADDLDLVDTSVQALARTVSRLGSEKGPTVKAPMVVDARAAASLVSRLLGPANARSVQQERSFWAPLIGEQVFSKRLTIVDDPLIARGLASRRYDSEGISARALPLVEEGVVRNIYVDTYYGRKGDMAPTTGSPSNRVVKPGDHSLADLLSQVDEGVYVTSWLGGNADGTTGDFSLGLRGHMIENGNIGRPVGEMNVTGNLRDLFSRLELIGDDPYPYSSTLTPSLVFSDVDFSGA